MNPTITDFKDWLIDTTIEVYNKQGAYMPIIATVNEDYDIGMIPIDAYYHGDRSAFVKNILSKIVQDTKAIALCLISEALVSKKDKRNNETVEEKHCLILHFHTYDMDAMVTFDIEQDDDGRSYISRKTIVDKGWKELNPKETAPLNRLMRRAVVASLISSN